MFRSMIVCAALAIPCLHAADAPANPQVASSRGVYHFIMGTVMKAAEQMPEENYSYKPTDSVRSYGQVLAHIADGQYEFCSSASGDKSKHESVEKTATTKAAIQDGLKTAMQYCDKAYSGMTDAQASEMVTFFGNKMTKLALMTFNIAHTDEHYGNLVTYLRMKGMVPPSSQGQ